MTAAAAAGLVAAGKGIPPMLFFHTGRRMAGETLSNEVVAALREAGVPAAAIHAADRDHAAINWSIGQPAAAAPPPRR
ncbi:MAG: hypothetical protein ACODAJ_16845 [Planctomycetota bacterium]